MNLERKPMDRRTFALMLPSALLGASLPSASHAQQTAAIVDGFEDYSLSRNGRYIVGNFYLPGKPFHCISVIDLKTLKGWHIGPPGPKALLKNANFSHDGLKLIFTHSPWPYNRTTKIFVSDMRGALVETVGGDHSYYSAPCFSLDGKKIAVFAGEEASVRLVEMDFLTGQSRILSHPPFGEGYHTAYDPLGRGIFFSAVMPLTQLYGADFGYEENDLYARNYLYRWGHELPLYPPPFAPPQSPLSMTQFCDVNQNGDALIKAMRSTVPLSSGVADYHQTDVVMLSDGKNNRVMFESRGEESMTRSSCLSFSSARISASGRFIVVTTWDWKPSRASQDSDSKKFIVLDRGRQVRRDILLANIDFEQEVLTLEAHSF